MNDMNEIQPCAKCGHEHQGARWAYICIGCPCPETPGKPPAPDFESDYEDKE